MANISPAGEHLQYSASQGLNADRETGRYALLRLINPNGSAIPGAAR